jgi:hypothetical protein
VCKKVPGRGAKILKELEGPHCGRDPERLPEKVGAPTKSGQAGGGGGVNAVRRGFAEKRWQDNDLS